MKTFLEYARNYRKEYDNYHAKPEQRERNAARLRARRLMVKSGKVEKFDKMDVHHKDNNPVNNTIRNLIWMSHVENTQAINTKKENSGYIRKVGNSWNARLRYMGNEYSFCKTDKEIVEKWLNDRNYEIKNKLPLTELPQDRTNNGGVYPRGDGWRGRITIDGKENTKTCKKKEDAEKWLENLK